jgi:uncharacterized protein (DUF433 family)
MAARLINTQQTKLRSWIDGYSHSGAGPIIQRQLPRIGGKSALGFLDLIDAMFVRHFSPWFSPQTIRRVAEKLRTKHNVRHPFAMDVRFRTDGKAIFMEEADDDDERKIVNLMNDNFEMGHVIESSLFQDIFYVDDLAHSWHPFRDTPLVVVTPAAAMGKPVLEGDWVPTRTLYDAYLAEGDLEEVASEYGLGEEPVKQAIAFEIEMERRVLH